MSIEGKTQNKRYVVESCNILQNGDSSPWKICMSFDDENAANEQKLLLIKWYYETFDNADSIKSWRVRDTAKI